MVNWVSDRIYILFEREEIISGWIFAVKASGFCYDNSYKPTQIFIAENRNK